MYTYLGLTLDTLALLAGFVLAFGALTIIWRRHWEMLGPTESLVARLAAAALVAFFALAGTHYLAEVATNTLQPNSFGPPPATIEGRNQALAVMGVGLALTVIGVLRIELYHRRVTGISHRGESEEEWQTEEPEEKRVPRER